MSTQVCVPSSSQGFQWRGVTLIELNTDYGLLCYADYAATLVALVCCYADFIVTLIMLLFTDCCAGYAGFGGYAVALVRCNAGHADYTTCTNAKARP